MYIYIYIYYRAIEWYGRPKNEQKFLKFSPVFLNFNELNNSPFFLPNYLISLLSCLASKVQIFCRFVCLAVRSPILSLKSWSQYMYRYAQKCIL